MGSEPNNIVIPHDFLKRFPGDIVAHNMKFDWITCTMHGLELPTDKLQDTMMLSVYLDENHVPGHSLDAVLKRYLGEKKKKIEAEALIKFGWEKAPTAYMGEYACQDTEFLPLLFQTLVNQSSERHLRMWEEFDRRFMLLLAEIEMRGIPIDRELCQQLETKCLQRLAEIRQELGFDPAKPSQLHPKLFDDPPYGLGLVPSEFTPRKGSPKVSLEWLQRQGHPVTALVYEYRKTQKQLSSYFSAYLGLTTRDYPRLHPNFKQHGTETGRLSCENPNLQQIPREEYKDASVKKLFKAEQGKQLWEIDYRTIEYRLQAVYANSSQLIDLFENEGDFHQLVADDVSAKSGLEVTRQKAKTINYLMSFGGGVGVLAAQLGLSYNKAKTIHEAYKAAYPEIFDKSDECQLIAEQDMQVDMWFGRTRHFRFASETHKAFNAVIQGGSFEIVKRSMLALQEAGFTISNQVHDSVWLNVDGENDVIEAQHIMEDWTKPTFGLSFRTDRKRLN